MRCVINQLEFLRRVTIFSCYNVSSRKASVLVKICQVDASITNIPKFQWLKEKDYVSRYLSSMWTSGQLLRIPPGKGYIIVELHHLEQPSWLSRKGKRNKGSNELALLCFDLPSTHRSLAVPTTLSCPTPQRLINAAEQIKCLVDTVFSVKGKILEASIFVCLYPQA